jgi:phage/plasmid-associated DNA primase
VQDGSISGQSSQIYSAYQDWAERNGIRFPMTQKAMSLNLKGRGFETKKDGQGNMVWKGLGLTPAGTAPSEKASPERVPSAGPEEQDDLPF